MATLDDVRAAYPHLGVALYAYTPGGAVTLECHAPNGRTFKFTGPTEAAAIKSAFPELAPQEPEQARKVDLFE